MLHYVASLAEKSNSELLTIPEDLAILEEASKTSLEQLSIEVTQLDNQIKKIANQMKQAQEDVKKQMSEFLDYASGVRYQFFIQKILIILFGASLILELLDSVLGSDMTLHISNTNKISIFYSPNAQGIIFYINFV